MARVWRWVVTAVLACLFITSCGSGTDADRASDDAAGQDVAEEAQHDVEEQPGSDMAGDDSAEADRQIITNAYAAVEVDDPEAAVEDLLSRTASYDGHIEDRQQNTDDDGNPEHASLRIRIPAEHLSDLVEELAEIGEVSEISESARDVTGTVRDLEARIEALQTSVDRLLDIMSEADSAEELLQVETTLSERQADLEALQAQHADLSDQVAMSTLEVELSTQPITSVEPDGFLGGLQSGWSSLVTAANALLVLAGALLPWLVVLAVPGVVVLLLIRRRARGRAGSHKPSPEAAAVDPDPAEGEPQADP